MADLIEQGGAEEEVRREAVEVVEEQGGAEGEAEEEARRQAEEAKRLAEEAKRLAVEAQHAVAAVTSLVKGVPSMKGHELMVVADERNVGRHKGGVTSVACTIFSGAERRGDLVKRVIDQLMVEGYYAVSKGEGRVMVFLSQVAIEEWAADPEREGENVMATPGGWDGAGGEEGRGGAQVEEVQVKDAQAEEVQAEEAQATEQVTGVVARTRARIIQEDREVAP